MSAREWLSERDRGVPATLAQSLVASAAESAAVSDSTAFDALVAGGLGELHRVLAAEPMTRAEAVPLLTADALVTYAFEAAADEPESLAARADDIMARIGELGGRA